VNVPPRTQGTSTIYNSGRYLDGNIGWHEGDAYWKATRVHALLSRMNVVPGSICDIGCGTGAILHHLGEMSGNSPSLTGFEISRHCVDEIRKKRPSIEVVPIDASTYALRKFDLALVLDVVEHVEDYLGFMRSLHHLADLFIFHIPLDMSVQTVARSSPLTRSRSTIGHIHYFSYETALASLEDAGFEIVETAFTTGSPEYRGPSWRRGAVMTARSLTTRLIGQRLSARLLGGFSLLAAVRSVG